MNLQCVIIDDEPLAIKIIEDYIQKTPFLELKEKYTNPVKAVSYLNENEVDLVFIDIQMPDLTGLDLISKLKQKPLIIFTTAYSQYALNGFKADAIDYLLKPIDYPDFLKAVIKAKEWYSVKTEKATIVRSNQDFLFIRSEHKIIRVFFNDILYIQGMNEYVRIFTSNAKPIMSLLRLKTLEEQLPGEMFMRVHKSYIVNLQSINMIERNEIVYKDGTVIPVSQQYKTKFQDYIDKNFML